MGAQSDTISVHSAISAGEALAVDVHADTITSKDATGNTVELTLKDSQTVQELILMSLLANANTITCSVAISAGETPAVDVQSDTITFNDAINALEEEANMIIHSAAICAGQMLAEDVHSNTITYNVVLLSAHARMASESNFQWAMAMQECWAMPQSVEADMITSNAGE